MSQQIFPPITPERFLVPNDLTIYNTAQVRESLIEVLKKGVGVELDFSNLAEIDTSGIQLLISLKKISEPVYLKSPSQALKRIVKLLDIEQQIPDIIN